MLFILMVLTQLNVGSNKLVSTPQSSQQGEKQLSAGHETQVNLILE